MRSAIIFLGAVALIVGFIIVAAMQVGVTMKSITVDVRKTTVDGVPCIVANDATGVALSCDWSKK